MKVLAGLDLVKGYRPARKKCKTMSGSPCEIPHQSTKPENYQKPTEAKPQLMGPKYVHWQEPHCPGI